MLFNAKLTSCTEPCVALHQSFQALQWITSSNTQRSASDLLSTVVFSSALCFRYRWVVIFFLCASFWRLAVIVAFMEDIVWCAAPVHNPSSYQDGSYSGLPRLLAEKPCHTSGPSSGPSLTRSPTSLSDHFFIYLTEKLHLECRRLNKEKEGGKKNKKTGHWEVGW